MKKLVTISLILSLSAFLTACGSNDVATDTNTTVEETSVTAENNTVAPETPAQSVEAKAFLTDAEALQKAEEALKALPQFEGKPFNVFQNVIFYDDGNGAGRIIVEIQDPNNEENIDHYEYNAKDASWSEPQPVQVAGGGDMSANVTPLADFKFSDVSNIVVPMWHEKAKEDAIEPDEANPSLVTMMIFVPNQERFWQTSMATPRANYFLRVNLDGTLKSFEKN